MDNIMKMSITKFLALIAMFLWGSQLMAGSVTVPNVFVGGTSALASDVNANFSAIKTEVDDNDGRIIGNATDISNNAAAIAVLQTPSTQKAFRIVDADSIDRGTLLSHHEYYIKLITDNGYIQTVNLDGSPYLSYPLSYTTSDCTGTAYTGQHVNGIVFLNDINLYYTAMDAVPTQVPIKSTFSQGQFTGVYACSQNSSTGDFYVANLNDFSITSATSAIGKNPFKTVFK